MGMPCKWVNKSIEIAMDKAYGYLDKLLEVYPATPAERGFKLSNEKSKIEELFNKIDDFNSAIELIIYLLSFEKFPIEYPYIAFLRALKTKKGTDFLKDYLRNNPNLVDKIKGQLKEVGLKKIYEGIEAPKEANRRMGQLFRQWLKEKKFSGHFRSREELVNESNSGFYFLDGSEVELLSFAQEILGYSGDKRPDFVGKVVSRTRKGYQFYIVGEAKFLTDYGGHQNDQLKDALDLLDAEFNTSKSVIPVAVLDGVIWIEGGRRGNSKMLKTVLDLPNNKISLSALLLEDFLNCLLNHSDISSCI